jgi:ABC-2 type transport system ATP-binding protein
VKGDLVTSNSTDRAAVLVDGIRKKYGDKTVVDDISFTVAEGEFFGILGPNGAGKTTTLEIVEGLREPDAGTVELLGERPWPRNPRLLPRMGVQLQASSFFERLTTIEQLRTFGALYGAWPEKAAETLDLVGLTPHANVRESALSGGQRQRLSIACALVHDPDLLFLDEPTAALDPQSRRNLWDVLRAVQDRGKTIVLTTHHLDEAEILCDRVAIMDNGRVLALDTPANLINGLNAPTRVTVRAHALPVREALQLPGANSVSSDDETLTLTTDDPAAMLSALAAHNALEGLQVHTATLEDVFLTLTGREYRS